MGDVATLPYSIRVLLEACLRNLDGFVVHEDDILNLARWNAAAPLQVELPFMPGRVVLQDFTGVPAVVDLAALRSAMVRMGGDPKKHQPAGPLRPGDRSQRAGRSVRQSDGRWRPTSTLEFERNLERYQFLRWGQQAFDNFRVIPPATGIVHQVNLEYLAKVVLVKNGTAFPDASSAPTVTPQ